MDYIILHSCVILILSYLFHFILDLAVLFVRYFIFDLLYLLGRICLRSLALMVENFLDITYECSFILFY
jgi:hypothetical protein